jgi:hypothetical protein
MHLYSPHSFHLPAATGKVYIVMESRLGEIPGAVPKAKKGGKGKGGDAAAEGVPKGFEVGTTAGLLLGLLLLEGATAGAGGRCRRHLPLHPVRSHAPCMVPAHSSHPSLLYTKQSNN